VFESRRSFVAFVLGAVASLSLGGAALAQGANSVVLTTSAPEALYAPVVAEFEKRTGMKVDVRHAAGPEVVASVLSARSKPTSDVVWLTEPNGMIRLAKEGALSPLDSSVAKERPRQYTGSDALWHGFAARARGFAINTADVSEPPTDEFSPGEWQFRHAYAPLFSFGMFVIPYPEDSTTGAHFGALYTIWGEYEFQKWCFQNRRQQMRLVPDSAEAARTVAMREAAGGVADASDVYAQQALGRPIEFLPLRNDLVDLTNRQILSFGPIVLPNTVGVVKNAPNASSGAKLAEFLLSADVERMLAKSEWKTVPVRPEVAKEFPELEIEDVVRFNYEEAAANTEAAIAIFRRAFPN
jgi:iron(III) transport system substrate-binding protein